MRSCLILVLAAVVCSAAVATPPEVHSLVRHRRQVDILSNIRRLIEDLIENLRAAATHALDSVKAFEDGLLEQGKLVREKLLEDLKKLKEGVADAIQGVVDRIIGSGAAVKDCIDSQSNDAAALFNDTMDKAIDCADERIAEMGIQIQNLKNHSNDALAFADSSMENMQKCVDDNPGNIFNVGSCLGRIALKAKTKGAVFAAQSAISIARVDLAFIILPAAMEVCVGTQLVSAGVVTSKIVMEIGSCSASSIFTNLIGNSV